MHTDTDTDPIAPGPAAGLAANADLVRRFVAEVWGAADAGRLAAFVAADFVDHAYQPPTAAGHAAMVRTLAAAVPDAQWTIEQLACERDLVLCRLRLCGHHGGAFRGTPASGRPIDVVQYRSWRIAGGRVAEHWALFDTARFLAQIGALPADGPACAMPAAPGH